MPDRLPVRTCLMTLKKACRPSLKVTGLRRQFGVLNFWLVAARPLLNDGIMGTSERDYAMGASRTPAASAPVLSFWSQTAKSVSAAPTASRLARWTASAPRRACRLAR